MNVSASFAKVIGRDFRRSSRVHTARGEVVLRGAVSAALARYQRANTPWMNRPVIRRLEEMLNPGTRLLELGSGSSTAWYAQRCGEVVSVESSHEWAARTRALVAGRSNVRVLEQSVADYLRDAEEFDVAIVDHHADPAHSRVDSVRRVRQIADVIVLDDSDRGEYAELDAEMLEWHCERYVGYKSRPFQPSETTIWLRPTSAD